MHFKRFRVLSGILMAVAAVAVAVGAAMPAAAAPDDGQWDPTLPKILSAGAPGEPLSVERDEPALANLHRMVFAFNRRDHGRLRMLINYLNDLV